MEWFFVFAPLVFVWDSICAKREGSILRRGKVKGEKFVTKKENKME